VWIVVYCCEKVVLCIHDTLQNMRSIQPDSVSAPTEVNTVTTQPDAHDDHAVPGLPMLEKTGHAMLASEQNE
jgi:hypothetical protein